MQYRRANTKGGFYFFTVNLADRKSDLLVKKIADLRDVLAIVKKRHPFSIISMVVIPDHLHAIWRLPENDHNYPLRWSLIKSAFSRGQNKDEYIRNSRASKRERGIWQRRYWEHLIRDEDDLARHIDYIHYSPVKHGLVKQTIAWPHSTLASYVARGDLPEDWGAGMSDSCEYGER